MSRYESAILPGRWSLDRYNAGRLLVPVVVVLIWVGLSRSIGADFLPGPGQTLGVIVEGFTTGQLLPNTVATLEAAVYAFAFAVLTGLPVGVILGLNRLGFDLFEPPIVSMYAIPKLTFYPIFLFVFGIGMSTKVFYAGGSAFFPMALLTMRAVQSIDSTYMNLGRSLKLSRYQLFRHIIFPTTIVQLVVALRLTFSSMFVSLVVAELFVSRAGLGNILQLAMGVYNVEQIMAVTVILTVVAFVVNVTLYGAQRLLERHWNMTADEMKL